MAFDEFCVNLRDIQQAAGRLSGIVHRTPLVTCATLNGFSGRELFFKCENLQKVGAYKFRGASNAIAQLDPATASRGVVTHSSGNHAQALALAAKLRGIPAHIVMPENASAVKRRAVIGYGGRVVSCANTLEARESTAANVQRETGATMIPPYDHPHIIAGAGTVALEIIEEMPNLDAIVCPVGGGGLLSGTALALRELNPKIRVIAAEPLGADDAARSKAAGEFVPQLGAKTVADGLRSSLGTLTWPVIRDLVERVITVREDEIIQAMRLTWERAKIFIEVSSAVAVAVVLSEEFRQLKGLNRVGVILSGGNVDLDALPW